MKVIAKYFNWDHKLMKTETKTYKTKSDANRWVNSTIGYFVRNGGYGRVTTCDEGLNKVIAKISGYRKVDVYYYEFEFED